MVVFGSSSQVIYHLGVSRSVWNNSVFKLKSNSRYTCTSARAAKEKDCGCISILIHWRFCSTPTRSSCPSNVWHCQPVSRFYRGWAETPPRPPQTERGKKRSRDSNLPVLSQFCHLVQKSSCGPAPPHTYLREPLKQLQNTTRVVGHRQESSKCFCNQRCMLAPMHQGIMYEPRPKCYYTR